MVRVYISVDMEGVAGISHANPTRRGDYGYAQAVELMVGEANAAIEGAFDGGATAVTVNDSHGGMYNLTPEALDKRARVVLGKKPLSMNEAIAEANLDVALFVGYHARAGHPTGVISHTYNPRAVLVEVDGRPITEAGINALYLGAFGVPVAMVTGDDALAAELDDWLPWAETVVVKHAISYQAADSVHPALARDMIRDAARRSVERARGEGSTLQPLTMEPPIDLRIEFTTPAQADFVAVMPGFDRIADRSVVFVADDAVMLFRALISAVRMAPTADD
ncbi:MAG TPA: M55 family metallopeptidase [Candidatus Limnocylindrales bacterium]